MSFVLAVAGTTAACASAPAHQTAPIASAIPAASSSSASAAPIANRPIFQGHPRALLLGPKYTWTDAKFDVDNTMAALDQAGVPYDVQPAARAWETLMPQLAQYTLLIVPGYLETGALSAPVLAALEAFAAQGGVVVVMKPIGDVDEPEALHLAGLKSATKHPEATELRIDGNAPALAAIDRPEEKDLPLIDPEHPTTMDVWTYEVDPAAKTIAIAQAFAGKNPVGAVATRRPVGSGAIYAWGHDLTTFDGARCYVNCFEPAGDILRLFLREAFREGSRGHVLLAHTMPGTFDSTLIMSHDIDAPDAYQSGTWGEPGALRMAAMEKKLGVRATYNITTDYVSGYFRPEIVKQLCDEGMCPMGDHSVRHLRNFDTLPKGTCKETRATYDAANHPTVCGEIRVEQEIVMGITGIRPRVWRSGYLLDNPALYDVLAASGIETTSNFGIGDLKYNLPVDGSKIGIAQQSFKHHSIFEFPVVCEDGIGTAAFARTELDKSNVDDFEAKWENALFGNAGNFSLTTALVHPSHGRDAPDENLQLKIDAVQRLIQTAQKHGIVVDTLDHFGSFWRARSLVRIDGDFDSRTGYRGTLTTGALPVSDFTIEFGDAIGAFSCEACGRTETKNNRVVIHSTLPASTTVKFTAALK
jgi:peptidoglycan/xylan/chitin deacetylase (PgdA/CDA1 family)